MLVATGALMFNEDIKIKEAQVMLNENIKNLPKGKRNFAGGAGDQAECSKADGIKMGKRSFPNKRILRNNLCLPACKQKNIATKLRDTA